MNKWTPGPKPWPFLLSSNPYNQTPTRKQMNVGISSEFAEFLQLVIKRSLYSKNWHTSGYILIF